MIHVHEDYAFIQHDHQVYFLAAAVLMKSLMSDQKECLCCCGAYRLAALLLRVEDAKLTVQDISDQLKKAIALEIHSHEPVFLVRATDRLSTETISSMLALLVELREGKEVELTDEEIQKLDELIGLTEAHLEKMHQWLKKRSFEQDVGVSEL